ncbi:MAG TPA: VCBS repeat-containing protein [Mucilaginibacter sp.]|jgi:hypothetical protein|nr:VCBS repeat-containing protein [Mucilaginibacter sp.]
MNLNKSIKAIFFIVLATGSLSSAVLLNGCGKKNNSTYQLTGNVVEDGKNLVKLNCAKCHALVPVDALNKNVWKFHTLPSMAKYLNISNYSIGYYKSETDTGGLSLVEWQSIVAYYEKMAPDTLLSAAKPTPLLNDMAGFKLKMPAEGKHFSYTTMAGIDPNTRKIYTSDQLFTTLNEWDDNFNMKTIDTLPSPAVSAIFHTGDNGSGDILLSCVGETQQIDFANGRIIDVKTGTNTTTGKQTLIASDLNHPVQTIEADFNKDGRPDLLVLSQGKLKGAIYLLTQGADHSYTQSTISDHTGAVQAIAGDFDHDGWTDFMVLFGTGDEGIWMFLNDHKGGFTAKNLLRFPPVYGSTSFQLVDMDHDGQPDLVYTCGYNFRDSRIMKPYHGVYIFKNMGNWNFKQKWFYPIDGCTKAIAADFDGDGDIDMMTSAYFADLKNDPAESCVYFEQVSPFNFKAHAIPVSKYGRWYTMETGDYNGDGKPDIILGNFSAGYVIQPDLKPFWNKFIPFVVLENNFKK